jgi:hypothetical protein
MSADVSEEHVASIVRVKEQVKQETSLHNAGNIGFLLGLFFDPDDGDNMFLRNIG